MKKGFTAIETLLTLGIIAITAGMSVPMYQNYQIRSDLDLAVAQTLHNLASAQLKSQSGEEDGQWGVSIEDGTVFTGENYVTRDDDFDDTIALPIGISVFGITEVMYSRIDGIPSPAGEVIIEAENGERRIITISEDGIADNTDPIDPCAAAFTMNNGRITVAEKSDVSFKVLGSHVTYGNNGPEIQMHLSVSIDGGTTWEPLFGFKDVDGGEQYTIENVAANSTILLRAEGRRGWLFKKVTTSGDGSGRIKMLQNKHADPDTTIFRTPVKLKTFMKKVIKSRKVSIKSKQILSLIEIQDIDGSEDYQDAAILITLEKPASQGICGASSDDDDEMES
ncbi:hypothetical protein HOL63_03655 [Candidatus Peregrinibacteria bacterium]|jgi:Tfp pilus assembly major pilin PilA|nr:hypothetical protein [Candidatus Peregrinibacteria bacterium]MBT5468536.1 hypothetical protein [Candidatus Peregrinibacteria bacterium]MBT7337460.1 hypothetical protein [Candidatus Peregrinibacteria bacterium]